MRFTREDLKELKTNGDIVTFKLLKMFSDTELTDTEYEAKLRADGSIMFQGCKIFI